MTDVAVADLLTRHAEAWTALSRLYLAPPSAAVLASLRAPEMAESWPLDTEAGSRTALGLSLVAGSTEDAETVGVDHRNLFVGPDRLRAAPYESVHVSEERLLFEESTLRVREAYAEFGLAAPHLNQEPDDHVGLELEFMATLAQRAVDDPDQAGRYLTALAEFIGEHVGAWVPGFADQVVAEARTDLWRGLGHLLAGTVELSLRTFAANLPAATRSGDVPAAVE